jgi:hypothetical protein
MRKGATRRASPVASSVSTNSPLIVASFSAGASRSAGRVRQGGLRRAGRAKYGKSAEKSAFLFQGVEYDGSSQFVYDIGAHGGVCLVVVCLVRLSAETAFRGGGGLLGSHALALPDLVIGL